jgi:hypothetical protein
MSKKKDVNGWIWSSLALSVILLIAYFVVATGDEFQVVYTQAHVIPGYEPIPAGITVYESPASRWSDVAGGLKMAGWICFILVAAGNFLAWKWDYKLGTLGTPWARIGLCMGPVFLCMVLWFAGYSSRNDRGAYTGSFEKFKTEFKISEAQAAQIVKEGGSGNLNIKDENGLLTQYFKQ